jgi:alkylhydroperoxidase family enzyme
MAWIKTIPEDQAEGKLADAYRIFGNRIGIVPNIMKAFSMRPELTELFGRVATTVTFGGSRLTRVQEEMIATVVSSINRCHY